MINPNVKSKIALRKADVGDVLQADSCDFTALGTITLAERLLDPIAMKMNVEVCISDLENDWIARSMSAGSGAGIPANENAMFLDLMAKRVAAQIERMIWLGDTTALTDNLFDGFIKTMLADGAVIDVPAPIAITSANVLSELARAYSYVPDAILNSPNLRIYVPFAVWRAYTTALGTDASNYQWDVQKGHSQVFYQGVELIPSHGFGTANNRLVIAEKSNLVFGTDLVSDFDNIKVIDMRETLGADKVRFKGRMKGGVQYAVSEEIVLY